MNPCVGGNALKQLEAHLARVQLGISEAVSPKTLGEAAKREGKGLLKIAQAGLRNTAGGLGAFVDLPCLVQMVDGTAVTAVGCSSFPHGQNVNRTHKRQR